MEPCLEQSQAVWDKTDARSSARLSIDLDGEVLGDLVAITELHDQVDLELNLELHHASAEKTPDRKARCCETTEVYIRCHAQKHNKEIRTVLTVTVGHVKSLGKII